MSPLLWVCWQSLKNIHTSCNLISLKCIYKHQHLCRKVHEQIRNANLSTVLSILKGRKLRKMGQNHSTTHRNFSPLAPKYQLKVRAIYEGWVSLPKPVFIISRIDNSWRSLLGFSLKESFLAHICSTTSAQKVLKQRKSYTIQSDLQSESSKINSTFQHKSVKHTMHLILFSPLFKCLNFPIAMLGRMDIIFSQLFQKVLAF